MPTKRDIGFATNSTLKKLEDQPQLGFDAARENYLIARALHIAAKAILSDPRAAHSEAEEMRAILGLRHPHCLQQFLFADDLKRALRLGFMPEGEITAEQVKTFIVKQEQKSLYNLADDIPF